MASINRPSQSAGSDNPPSNNLWIGNISHDVSDSELKTLLERYGKVDKVACYPTRNYAFIYFKEIEDAKSAKQGLQGHIFHGSPLKIEFVKPAKPCKSLWVSGISQSVSKEELEKEFIKFGKIQEFRFLRDRSTAYVDYIKLEDATQALKTMNGKRIGGDQLRVDFLRSQPPRREQGPDAKEAQFFNRNMGPSDHRWMGQDSMNPYPEPSLAGSKRPHQFLPTQPSRVLVISHPPSVIVEEDMLHNAMILFGEIEGITTFPDKNFAFVEFRSAEEAKRAKEGLQGRLFNDPRISIEYSNIEISGVRGPGHIDALGLSHPVLPDNNYNSLLPPSHGIRGPPLGPHSTFQGPEFGDLAGPNWRSSPTAVGSSPSAGFSLRPASGVTDLFDSSQFQRDSKRSRFDTPDSLTRVTSERDCVWRGLITKGGTPVCRARCVPFGEGIDADIPDIVNCSARTGLDILSKHYEKAIGFSIVFFLPDSKEDFASYTEFLRYLGSRNRAGVAKFDDGTTLFLVPPSDFLTKLLKVNVAERLYGVVLKIPPPVVPPSNPSMNPPSIHPQFAGLDKTSSFQTAYGATHSEENILPLDNSRVLPEDSRLPLKAPGSETSSFPAHSVPPTSVASQKGFSLPPELIATLSSFLPVKNSSSGAQTASAPQMPSMVGPTSYAAPGLETNIQQWNHEHHQMNSPQLQHAPQPRGPPTILNMSDSFYQPFNPYTQMHGRAINLPPQRNNPMAPEINQHYQQGGSSHDFSRSQGMIDHGTDAARFYNSSIVLQPAYSVALSNQVQGNGVSQQQTYMSQLPPELQTNQNEQVQAAPHGVMQENAETEADKNERYKTTLLFAANLLSQIHQTQGNQPGQSAGNH